jgi:hypothetical protein
MGSSKTSERERHPRWSPYTKFFRSSDRQRSANQLEGWHWSSTRCTLNSSINNISLLGNKGDRHWEQQLTEMDRGLKQKDTMMLNPDKTMPNSFFKPYKKNWLQSETENLARLF